MRGLGCEGDRITLYAQWANGFYKVAFNANGGTLPKGKTMAAQTMTYGKSANLRKNVFTRKGYVFIGWAKSPTGAVAYKNGAAVKNLRTDGKTTTLYAKWAKESYMVAFNANGGKGKMAAQKMTYGKSSNLRANAFTRKGWLFLGWAKSPDGAVAYKNKAEVKNLRTDGKTTTLYAVWEKAQTVKFNANGGTCSVADKDIKVGNAYGAFPTPERKWHTFLGWFSAATGGEWVAETDVAETSATRTLFAHWEYIPLVLGETTKTVGPDAAAKLSVSVSAKAAWTAAADADWITIRTKSGTSGSGSLVFDVAKNAGMARTGRIIVSAGGKATVLTVTQKARTLALSASKKIFKSSAAKKQKLGVTATVAWTVKSSAKWLKVKTAKGKGNGTIIYELAANKGAGRAATITVSGGGKTVTFRVEQKGPEGSEPAPSLPSTTHFLRIEPSRQTCNADGTTDGMALVESDISWTVTTTDNWIKILTTTGSEIGGLAYEVASNSGEKRTGSITVTGGTLTATLAIDQAGASDEALFLFVSPTDKTIAAVATDDAVWVEANVAWTVCASEEWIGLSTLSGRGNGRLAFSLAANTSSESRSGTITVSGGGMVAQVRLTQEGIPESPQPKTSFLRVNPQSRAHGEKAASDAFLVEANVAWAASVSSGTDWIVLHTFSGSQNGKVSYSLSQNTTHTNRTGTITVRGGGMSAVFTISQVAEGKPQHLPTLPIKGFIEVFPAEVKFDGENGYKERTWAFLVNSTVAWVAVSYEPWIHVLTTSGGPGLSTVYFSIDENTGTISPHIGTIYVNSQDAALFLGASYGVWQRWKPKWLYIEQPLNGVPGKGASNLRRRISTGFDTKDWTVKASPWIKIKERGKWDGGGYWSGYITFDVEPNPEAKSRTGEIVVSAGGVTSRCVVTQNKGVGLKVTPSKRSHDYRKGNGQSLQVVADPNKGVEATSNVPWIKIRPGHRRKGGQCTILYDIVPNNTYKPRSGAIVVSCDWDKETIPITQGPTPLLEVSPASMKVPYKGLCYAFSVKSNIKWKASVQSGGNWLTLTPNPTNGKGNGGVSFSVSKNTTGKDRKATIVVTGGGLTRTVTVIQTKEPKITLSPTKMTVSYKGASYKFSVLANVKWKATSGTSWLSLTQASGNGNGTVSFKVTENTTSQARTAKITVTGGGKSVVFTLTQKGRPNLCFYRPVGWPAAVFVTTSETDTTERTTFTAWQAPPPCIRYAWANVGGSATGYFTIKETITGPNGSTVTMTDSYSSLPVNKYNMYHLYYGVGSGGSTEYAPDTPGTYKVTVTLDVGSAVTESDETDNTTTVYFTVVSGSSVYSASASSRALAVSPDAAEDGDDIGDSDLVEKQEGDDDDTGKMPDDCEIDTAKSDENDWVAVTASGGENIGAVADGDEETAWRPDATDGAWVVLTFAKPRLVQNVELVGDNLPEGASLFFSEDSENWQEELPAQVQYVWVAFPASERPFAVREIKMLFE